MKKRIFQIFCTALITALLFTGCKVEFVNRVSSPEPAVQSTQEASAAESSGPASSASSSESESSAVKEKKSSKAASSSDKASSAAKQRESTQSKAKTASSSQPQKASGPTVTILINCANASAWNAKNGYSLSSKIVPKSGVILAKTTAALQKGDTVYSVLIRVCKSRGILVVHAEGYIESINNLFTLKALPSSGWLYCVNSVYPKVGCQSYKLKSGDAVEWHYTCTKGDLPGANIA